MIFSDQIFFYFYDIVEIVVMGVDFDFFVLMLFY